MEEWILDELGIPPTARSVKQEIAFLYPSDEEKVSFAKRVRGMNFFDVRRELNREREARIIEIDLEESQFIRMMEDSPREALLLLFQEAICDLKLKRALDKDSRELYRLHNEHPCEWLLNVCRLLP